MTKKDDTELMVAFTVGQLQFCYEKLVLYPEIQEEIKKFIKKLENYNVTTTSAKK